MWLVLALERTITMESAYGPQDWNREMDLSWADGMVGALPVFEDEEAARSYAAGRYQVVRMEPGKPENATEQ